MKDDHNQDLRGERLKVVCRPNFQEILLMATRNPARTPGEVDNPIICRVFYIPGGCLGFLPSTAACVIKEIACLSSPLIKPATFGSL